MSVCQYSVIQLYPDSIAGEVVNIAVVVVPPDGPLLWHPLKDWSRAQAFAGEDLEWCQQWLADIQATWDAGDVNWYVHNAHGSTQATPFRGSIRTSPQEVLERMGELFIKEPTP